MKLVIIEIELEIDETQHSNSGIALGIEQVLINNEYGQPNYIVCRDKLRHSGSGSQRDTTTPHID